MQSRGQKQLHPGFAITNNNEPLKIQSSPKCKARKKFRRAAYVGYVSKKFFTQHSSWDEM
jgi:hypothetical protein